jgi:hypothetical protein
MKSAWACCDSQTDHVAVAVLGDARDVADQAVRPGAGPGDRVEAEGGVDLGIDGFVDSVEVQDQQLSHVPLLVGRGGPVAAPSSGVWARAVGRTTPSLVEFSEKLVR